MATVVIDMSISLDGFVAGPNDGPERPLGERGGERIFDWYQAGGEAIGGDPRFRPSGADRPIVEEMFAASGAVVSGRRTYDIAGGWGGTFPVNALPVFVVTHVPPANPPLGESRMTFVTDGVERAIHEAREAAGDGVVGVSGASIAQQALRLGLVDELRLHVAPILLGDGVRLFEHLGDEGIELDFLDVISGPGATHLRYAVRRSV
jgi:dihydrofolate reductase